MHIYILGVCGTFMGSLAVLAREAGFQVSGCDANVYPPMSTQLAQAGIQLDQGYDPKHFAVEPDLIIVGNALSRGNPMVEYMLNRSLPFTSGPQFLHDYILKDRWVLAVAGTHGKTTTASMLAYILEQAGLKPGFLIGGVVQDFPFSARLGESMFFVVEADEYDTAFFDKRSKFVHYAPKTLVLNNLEFDHADIFDNLAAIQKQFHHLLRIVPGVGRTIVNLADKNLDAVVQQGIWSEQQGFSIIDTEFTNNADYWQAKLNKADGSSFCYLSPSMQAAESIEWSMTGRHNISNALAAMAAAEHIGVKPQQAAEALMRFAGVKRRMELLATVNHISVFDDFAHHPTAIASTLEGAAAALQAQNQQHQRSGKLIAVIEPRSNTMKMGVHQQALIDAVGYADKAFWFMHDQDWQLAAAAGEQVSSIETLIKKVAASAAPYDQIVIMSNGGFAGFHQRLIEYLGE